MERFHWGLLEHPIAARLGFISIEGHHPHPGNKPADGDDD